jgi:Arc/MetJ-type ribon-helix-helix transcriptional regulator
MTIHLPPELENSIRAEVLSGHFASEDEMIAAAVRDYLERQQPTPRPASQQPAATAHKPIWEVFQELSADVPAEVWESLPPDLSEQHDHYIYGARRNP